MHFIAMQYNALSVMCPGSGVMKGFLYFGGAMASQLEENRGFVTSAGHGQYALFTVVQCTAEKCINELKSPSETKRLSVPRNEQRDALSTTLSCHRRGNSAT